MRLKFLTVLMAFVLSISITVTVCRFGIGILEDNFVARLHTTYQTSAQFMCFYGLLNFYLFTMAYVYSPSGRPLHGNFCYTAIRPLPSRSFFNFQILYVKFLNSILEPNLTKDNPAFSMVNDSDEDVVYGSDDESRRPLNSSGKRNDYDSD